MNDVELFNKLARLARPAFREYVPVETLDAPFAESDLDSMDAVMISIYLCEIYGVPEEVAKLFVFITPADLFTQVKAHKTRDPQTVEEAMELVI